MADYTDRLQKLSPTDLQAVSERRMQDVSTEGLSILAGETGPPPKVSAFGRLLDAAKQGTRDPLAPAAPERFAARALNTAAFGLPGTALSALPGQAGATARRLFRPKEPGLSDMVGDITGFMAGGPAALERGVSGMVGRKLGERFLAKTAARAAGGAASMAPFALNALPERGPGGVAQEALELGTLGAVLPNVVPTTKAFVGGLFRGAKRAGEAILNRGARLRGISMQAPASVEKMLTAGERQERIFTRKAQRITEQGVKTRGTIRQQFQGKLEDLRTQHAAEVAAAEERLHQARTSPEQGEAAVKAATRVQQRLVGEEGYAKQVYKQYDHRINALEQEVADNEAIQLRAHEVRTALLKDLPEGQPPQTPFEKELLQKAEALGEGFVGVRQLKDLLKDLRTGFSAGRLAGRRMTATDHARAEAISRVMDLAGTRNEKFLEVQSWYKGHARVLDRAFRLLRPRGSEYETASRLVTLGARPDAVRGAFLKHLEAKAAEVGVSPQVQAEATTLGKGIQELEQVLTRTKQALRSQTRALAGVRDEALAQATKAAEEQLKVAQHVYRQYRVSAAGRMAGVERVPIGVPVPTVAPGRPRIRTLNAEQLRQMSHALAEFAHTLRAGLTPAFIRKGQGNRLLRGFLATQRD